MPPPQWMRVNVPSGRTRASEPPSISETSTAPSSKAIGPSGNSSPVVTVRIVETPNAVIAPPLPPGRSSLRNRLGHERRVAAGQRP